MANQNNIESIESFRVNPIGQPDADPAPVPAHTDVDAYGHGMVLASRIEPIEPIDLSKLDFLSEFSKTSTTSKTRF